MPASLFCSRKNVKELYTHALRTHNTSQHRGRERDEQRRWGGRNKAKEKTILSRGWDGKEKRAESYEKAGLNWDERLWEQKNWASLCAALIKRRSLGSSICYSVRTESIQLLLSSYDLTYRNSGMAPSAVRINNDTCSYSRIQLEIMETFQSSWYKKIS